MKMLQNMVKYVPVLLLLFVLSTACQSSSADVIELCMSSQPNLTATECECIDTTAQKELTEEQYSALINMMEDFEKDSRKGNESISGGKEEDIFEKDYYKHMSTLVTFLKNVGNKCRGK